MYADIPKEFCVKKQHVAKAYSIRREGYFMNVLCCPKHIEQYSLLLLICHVPGAKSFANLRMHDNILYDTFKEACIARNLLENDGEWLKYLKEANNFQMLTTDSYLLSIMHSAILLHLNKLEKNSNLHFIKIFYSNPQQKKASHSQVSDCICIHLKAHNTRPCTIRPATTLEFTAITQL